MQRKGIVYLVSFAAFLGPFTQTIYTPILPEVTGQFHTSAFLVNLTISIFTFFLAIMQMIYGPLTDSVGRRKVIVFGTALYIAASLGCFFSDSIGVLIFFRGLQAVGIAAGSVVAVTVIGDLFEGKTRGKAMGTFQMMVSLGPVAGPVIGGLIGGRFNFHGVFLALVAVGAAVLLLHVLLLKETKPEAGGEKRFSVSDFGDILREPSGFPIILLGFVQYYGLYNFLVFLPGVLTERYGLSPEQKGLVYLPLSIGIVVGSYVGGRLQERYSSRAIVVRTSYLSIAAVLLFLVLHGIDLPLLMATIFLFGLFLGFSLPVQTTMLTQIFQRRRATAIGVYNFFRYMGMAVGPMLGTAFHRVGGYTLLYGTLAGFFLLIALFLTRQLKSGQAAEAS